MMKRLWIYLSEMYPLTSWLGTSLMGFMVLTLAWRLSESTSFAWQTLTAALTLCFFSLLIRVMDEFKDFEDDKKNYPNRPLPSGRVKKSDLILLGWTCVGLSLVLSLWDRGVLLMAVAVLGFSFLMLKWFFFEAPIRRSLPLALATHHPIVLLHFGYVLAAHQATGHSLTTFQMVSILPLVAMMTNWEFCRKIRAPKDETAYTTYSKIWGPRPAMAVALVLQVVVLATGLNLLNQMGLMLVWGVVFTIGYLFLMTPMLNFFGTLTTIRPLKFWAEQQVLWTVLFLIIAGWWG